MEVHVSFRGRKPVPQHVDIGMERENKVTVLCFEGLPKIDGSTAYLHIDLGKNSDVIEIVDGQADVTRTITQFTGSVEAFVEVLGANDRVWHSQIMELFVGRLPILGEKIAQEYPTAFEQALAQTAADKAAAAKSAADAADAAAGIVTEEKARQDAERKRVAAETEREKAEANREQAETAREQEMAEALASVAGVENVVRANEQQRVLAENARAKAERQRESIETSRQTAESGRVTAEQRRVEAEAQRQQAEMARADAEGKRVQAEQGRVTAEQGRMEAETKREETMAQHAEKIAKLEAEVVKKAQIDDTTVSDTEAWSSQHIVDMLCPPLEESGNPVVCYPVANSNLDIVASWEPTQEGEGTPYPAGGGPNLLDMAQCAPTVGKPYGLTITIDGDIIKASGIPSSEVTEEGQYSFGVISCAQTELRGKGYKVTAFAVKGKISSAWGLRTESENSLAISTKLTPGVNTDIQFRLMVSKDTPAAYAPYANIRPIHGRDSVQVERCGKNIIKNLIYGYIPSNYIIIDNSSISVVTFLAKGGTYTLFCPKAHDRFVVAHSKTNNPQTGEALTDVMYVPTSNNTFKATFTGWAIIYVNSSRDAEIEASLMLVVGSAAPTTYTPYTGSTTTLTLPETVYGGTVDAVTGEGQETWKLITLDGTEDWAQFQDKTFFYTTKYSFSYNSPFTCICSHFDRIGVAGTSVLRIYTKLYDNVDTFRAYLAAQYAAGTPVQIAYKLATPVPFQATGGGTIKALSGTNTILTDADTLTVTGRADLIRIIQQLQAASAASAQALADVERAVTDI